MICEDCGAEAPHELCDKCTVARVAEARVASLKNAKSLWDWARANTHGPGEAVLSLLVSALLIHRIDRSCDRALKTKAKKVKQ